MEVIEAELNSVRRVSDLMQSPLFPNRLLLRVLRIVLVMLMYWDQGKRREGGGEFHIQLNNISLPPCLCWSLAWSLLTFHWYHLFFTAILTSLERRQ